MAINDCFDIGQKYRLTRDYGNASKGDVFIYTGGVDPDGEDAVFEIFESKTRFGWGREFNLVVPSAYESKGESKYYWVPPKFMEPVNQFKLKKMGVIKNVFKSKESKAVEELGLGTDSSDLNQEGLLEFVAYLYETDKDSKKSFLDTLVVAAKERK